MVSMTVMADLNVMIDPEIVMEGAAVVPADLIEMIDLTGVVDRHGIVMMPAPPVVGMVAVAQAHTKIETPRAVIAMATLPAVRATVAAMEVLRLRAVATTRVLRVAAQEDIPTGEDEIALGPRALTPPAPKPIHATDNPHPVTLMPTTDPNPFSALTWALSILSHYLCRYLSHLCCLFHSVALAKRIDVLV